MFNLHRREKSIIIFLVFTLLSGLSVAAYRKSHSSVKISVNTGAINLKDYISPGMSLPQEGPKININEAGIDELMKIKGVGKTLASRIIDYRSRNGLFISVDDTKNVKGIGPALFKKIKDRISVE